MRSNNSSRITEKCAVCGTSVRIDRLARHLAQVHPSHELKADERRRLEASRREPTTSGRSAGSWKCLGRHPGRNVALVAAVVVLALAAYSLSSSNPLPTGSTTAVVGKTAPDFTFTALDGSTASLSSYRGHAVVLWWIATFCSTCQVGTQLFAQTYYAQYHSAGVALLEVMSYNDLGQPGPSLADFASANGYTGQAGWVLGSGSSQGTSIYNPTALLDLYYVVNAQGVIVGSSPNLPPAFGTALQEAQAS